MATTHILAVGKIVAGAIEMDFAMLPLGDDFARDGELQRLIDEAADTEEYEDDMLDREFWARGGW